MSQLPECLQASSKLIEPCISQDRSRIAAEHPQSARRVTVATLPAFPIACSEKDWFLVVDHPLSRRQHGPRQMVQRFERANLILAAAASRPMTIIQACSATGVDVRERGRILRQLLADGKVRSLPHCLPLDIIDPLPYDMDHVRRGLAWMRGTELTVGDYVAFPLPNPDFNSDYVVIDLADHLTTGNYSVLAECIYYGRGRRQYAEAFDYLRQHPEKLVPRGKGFRDGERKRLLQDRGWSIRDFEDAQEQVSSPGADRRWFRRYIAADEGFAALSGYFVAEGHADDKAISWDFHKSEEDYWTEIGEVLRHLGGRLGTLRQCPGNGVRYRACCRPPGQVLTTMFGSGAHRKHVPEWWLHQPGSVLIAFLRALFNGDGHMIESRSRLVIGLTTVSEELACQVRRMLLSLGIVGGIMRKRAMTARLKDGRFVHSGPTFVVTVNGDQAVALAHLFGYPILLQLRNHRTLWFRDDRYLYLRVNRVEALDLMENGVR